jgi:hypothetical protein
LLDTDADLQQISRASDEIDKFIERRAEEREEANAAELAERMRKISYLRRRKYRHLEEWRRYFLTLAEAHEKLAAENRDRAARVGL